MGGLAQKTRVVNEHDPVVKDRVVCPKQDYHFQQSIKLNQITYTGGQAYSS